MNLNKLIVTYLDKKFYGNYSDSWDNHKFREFILNYTTPKSKLLDIGAGRGALPQMNFKNEATLCVGVDPDEIVLSNPYLHQAHVGVGDSMPFLERESFDIAISANVLEHLENPEAFFIEVSRVLKKGAVLITKTPNLYHYMPTIARLTPHSFHVYFNKLRGRSSHDTFPTIYKVNTKRSQVFYSQQAGLKLETFITLEGRPEYLRMTAATYLVGLIYERLVNILNLNSFKIVIFSVFRKT